MELSKADQRKHWLVCDANLFLHYSMFSEVDWAAELKVPASVLVVPARVHVALDHYKTDPRSDDRRRRAREVLRKFRPLVLDLPVGEPAPLKGPNELLVLYTEPPMPAALDPLDPDDRVIATALDFRWRRAGARVSVLSADGPLLLKARGAGVDVVEPPEKLRRRRFGADPES